MEEVERGLHTLLEKIKPALEQATREGAVKCSAVSCRGSVAQKVGKWILQFGDKVTKGCGLICPSRPLL